MRRATFWNLYVQSKAIAKHLLQMRALSHTHAPNIGAEVWAEEARNDGAQWKKNSWRQCYESMGGGRNPCARMSEQRQMVWRERAGMRDTDNTNRKLKVKKNKNQKERKEKKSSEHVSNCMCVWEPHTKEA